jgi:hypothetical protein
MRHYDENGRDAEPGLYGSRGAKLPGANSQRPDIGWLRCSIRSVGPMSTPETIKVPATVPTADSTAVA